MSTTTPADTLLDSYDAVVIGGGAAGLAGAVTLARSRRSVVVLDAGAPRNAPAEGVHALLGLDGVPPAELLTRGRAEVARYGGQVLTAEVATARPDGDDGFVVELSDGRATRARRLLVTTGLVDELPDVPGLAEQWGHDVVHCPYCHGWEVRDRRIVVLGTGPMSVHQALLFSQLSGDVTLLTHDAAPEPEQLAMLEAVGIGVVTSRARSVETVDGAITGVRTVEGTLPCDVVVVATRMVARAGFLEPLGLRVVAHPSGVGEHLPADAVGRTEVPGVWAAGNVTDLMAQAGASAAAGTSAGAQINADLVMADAHRAVARV